MRELSEILGMEVIRLWDYNGKIALRTRTGYVFIREEYEETLHIEVELEEPQEYVPEGVSLLSTNRCLSFRKREKRNE